jgi:hypothetical protein
MSGISMNSIVLRKLTHIYRSDASEFGLGGYNLIAEYGNLKSQLILYFLELS